MIGKNILPPAERLDHQIDCNMSAITEMLDTHYDTVGSHAPESDDERVVGILNEYAALLGQIVGGERSFQNDFIAFQAFGFAYNTANYLMPSSMSPGIDLHNYFKNLDDSAGQEAIAAMIRQDARQYLNANSMVELLLDTYVCELDPRGDSKDLARTVGALAFLQIEMSTEYKYIESVIKQMEAQF